MVNKSKKRSASESEVAVKVKQEFIPKKKKSANGAVQNGQAVKEVKKEVKPQVKVEKKSGDENKDKQSRVAFREKRKEVRAKNPQRFNPDISAEDVKKKIQAIESRENLSKSAKRKLASLKKILGIKEGTYKPKPLVMKKQAQKGKNEKQVATANKKQSQNTVQQKKKVPEKVEAKASKDNKKTEAKQGSLLLLKQERLSDDEDDDDDDDDDDAENSVDLNTVSSSEDEDNSDNEDNSDVEEEEEEDDDDDENDSDVEEEEEDENDDDDEEEEEEEEEEEVEEGEYDNDEVQEVKAKDVQSIPKQNLDQGGKKKRYVLFVGNLPFTATAEEIKKHFLTKASQIVDIRIPKTKENTSRGFAYVEFGNQMDYEKAMSLNNSFVNGRRIKVQYSGSNKKETVAKNQKLQALQRAGKLAGGQKKHFQKKGGWKGGKPNAQKKT